MYSRYIATWASRSSGILPAGSGHSRQSLRQMRPHSFFRSSASRSSQSQVHAGARVATVAMVLQPCRKPMARSSFSSKPASHNSCGGAPTCSMASSTASVPKGVYCSMFCFIASITCPRSKAKSSSPCQGRRHQELAADIPRWQRCYWITQ